MAATRLPANPHPEQYRRQAKELLKALAAGEPAALARFREFHPRTPPAGSAKLADAQLVLAREHGFAGWPAFAARLRVASPSPAPAFPARIACDGGTLGLEVANADEAAAVVLFVTAGNVGRHHLGVRQIVARLQRRGYCTVLADLLTDDEAIEDAIDEELRYDLKLLQSRAEVLLAWIAGEPRLARLPLALFGAGTGGAAAIRLAAEHPQRVRAMICCAGRPDLAGSATARVRAPTLFVVGGEDAVGHGFTRLMLEIFPRDVASRLEVVRGIGVRFEEGPAAARAAELAIAWLDAHLADRKGQEQAA